VYCIVQEKIKLNLLIACVNNNIKIKVLSIMAGIKKKYLFQFNFFYEYWATFHGIFRRW
jgi:hypothetical protein